MHKQPLSNNKLVKPGIYEIQSGVTSLFLNSVDQAVYNGWYDDALTLEKHPSRRGKWEVTKVGGGFTIKQVSSGMFCALADADQFVYQPVVLSSVPTIWTIEYADEKSVKVRIMWSVSDVAWETVRSNEQPLLAMGKLAEGNDAKPKETFTWNLHPVGEINVAGKIKPGLYSLQNKASETFVMMGPDEKTIGCWPANDFKHKNTKLWEIAPLGDGYTVRLHGTDKYCTMEEGARWQKVNVSNFPAAWKIAPNDSPLHGGDGYFQLYWGNTNLTWDLCGWGKKAAGTPIALQAQTDYQSCRLFKFIS